MDSPWAVMLAVEDDHAQHAVAVADTLQEVSDSLVTQRDSMVMRQDAPDVQVASDVIARMLGAADEQLRAFVAAARGQETLTGKSRPNRTAATRTTGDDRVA